MGEAKGWMEGGMMYEEFKNYGVTWWEKCLEGIINVLFYLRGWFNPPKC